MDDAIITTDVLIVGSGPAACSAGLILKRAGYCVTLIDRATQGGRPQFGECLPASGIAALRELGIEKNFFSDKHLSMQSYRVKWGDQEPYDKHLLSSAAGPGWLLNRERFDNMFITALSELGACILWHTSLTKIHANEHAPRPWKAEVKRNGVRQIIYASMLVDASGRARAVARRMGAKARKLDQLVTFSCRIEHSPNQRPPQNVVIVSDQHGWWYSAPYTSTLSSLNYFTDGDLPLPKNADSLLAEAVAIPELSERLNGATVTSSSHRPTTAAFTSSLDQCVGATWIAVGDAACSYDPLSSYGISSAIGSGIYGAKALLDAIKGKNQRLLQYQELMRTTFLNYLDGYQREYARVTNSTSDFWARRRYRFGQNSCH